MTHDPPCFAIQLGVYDDAAALADYGRRVEQLGYSEFYTADHIGTSTSPWSRPDPFVPLMVVAGATTLRVGTLVLNAGFYNPALLARTAASVDRFTGGRLILGLGAGYDAVEHESIGEPILPPGARVDRLGETLEVVTALLDDGAASVDGRHISVHIDDLGIRPASSSVPILIGGHGRRMVELAARYADIFQFTGLTHDADGTISGGGFSATSVDERARWLAEAAGNRDDQIVRSALVQFTAVGESAPGDDEVAAQLDIDPDIVADCPFVLTGSVAQVVDKIGRMGERFGISHWVVRDAEGFAPVVTAFG